MSVKRFEPVQKFADGGTGVGTTIECPDGDYVRYEDFAKLLAALKNTAALFDELDTVKWMDGSDLTTGSYRHIQAEVIAAISETEGA